MSTFVFQLNRPSFYHPTIRLPARFLHALHASSLPSVPCPMRCHVQRWSLPGQGTVWGGRAHVRAALYMAALVGARCNPVIRSFYQRLCNAGKAKKVALTACMRKLLTIPNAMMKHRTRWSMNEIVCPRQWRQLLSKF